MEGGDGDDAGQSEDEGWEQSPGDNAEEAKQPDESGSSQVPTANHAQSTQQQEGEKLQTKHITQLASMPSAPGAQ
jgi:hypothetical protein